VAGDLPNLGGVPALTFGLVNAGGAAATYVRTDASLAIFDAGVPSTIQCDDVAIAGVQPFAARRDHEHAIVCDPPVDVGVANQEGTAYSFARSDHVHNHPAGLGTNLHHNEVHVVNSTGPHAEAGLTIGHMLRVSGAAAFSFAAIQNADVPSALDVNPGTLTVATGNVAATPHTHAITTSANPGAAASILASSAAGALTLTGLLTLAAGITHSGASGANAITMPDNVAQAWHLSDAGGLEYMRAVSTNANPYLCLFPAAGGRVVIGGTAALAAAATLTVITAGTGGIHIDSGADAILYFDRGATANSAGILFMTALGNDWGFGTRIVGGVSSDLRLYSYGTAAVVMAWERATGRVVVGSGTGAAKFHVIEADAATITVTDVQILEHNTSGTPAAGYGTGLLFRLESSTTAGQDAVRVLGKWADAAHATRRATFGIDLNYAGTWHEVCRIVPVSSAGVAGNARGAGAVDLQGYRQAAAQVASGLYSVISGGAVNTASGLSSTIGGGWNHTISSNYATIPGGYYNQITTNDYATIGGGAESQATGKYSTIPGGRSALADKYGQLVHASGGFGEGGYGDAQGTVQFVTRKSVTHSTNAWHELFLDEAAQRMTIATDIVWTFDVLVVGTTQGCTKSFGFRIEGTIENDGGTTTLLNSTVTTIYDADDVSFDARAVADDANDALIIEVRDSDGGGDTVRWVATTRTAEVTYPA
jgi:hypothetical protein